MSTEPDPTFIPIVCSSPIVENEHGLTYGKNAQGEWRQVVNIDGQWVFGQPIVNRAHRRSLKKAKNG